MTSKSSVNSNSLAKVFEVEFMGISKSTLFLAVCISGITITSSAPRALATGTALLKQVVVTCDPQLDKICISTQPTGVQPQWTSTLKGKGYFILYESIKFLFR